MPLYEYQCQDCGEDFEKMVRFAEVDLDQPCPKCESRNTHKKISVAASLGGSSSSSGGFSGGCGSSGGFT